MSSNKEVNEFKKHFTALMDAKIKLNECQEIFDNAVDTYTQNMYCLFKLFTVTDKLNDEWYDCYKPITINFNNESIALSKIKFRIINGRVVNIYFKSSDDKVNLKYGELLSFFELDYEIELLYYNLLFFYDDIIN